MQQPDTVIYINVLEHISDDAAELKAVHEALAPGGYLLVFRLLKSKTMEIGAVRFYDRFAVPIVRRLEVLISPFVGKNVLAVARKADK